MVGGPRRTSLEIISHETGRVSKYSADTSPSEYDLSAPFNQISIHEARKRFLLAAQNKTR